MTWQGYQVCFYVADVAQLEERLVVAQEAMSSNPIICPLAAF